MLGEQTLYRTRPDVSIDGKRFIYSSSGGAADEFNHLYVLPTAGGEPYKLTFFEPTTLSTRAGRPTASGSPISRTHGGLPQLGLLETYGGANEAGADHLAALEAADGHASGAGRRREERASRRAPRIHLPASDGKFYAPPDAYSRIATTRMSYRSGDHVFHSPRRVHSSSCRPGKMSHRGGEGL